MNYKKFFRRVFAATFLFSILLGWSFTVEGADYIQTWTCGHNQDTSWCVDAGTFYCNGDPQYSGQVWCGSEQCGPDFSCYPYPAYEDYQDYQQYQNYQNYQDYQQYQQYQDYPDYPSYPSYPDYPDYPNYPAYEGTPSYPDYPDYPNYPSYPDYPSYGVFNYSLSNSGNVNVTQGSQNVYAQKTITKTLTSGVTQSVTLSIPSNNIPAGVSYSIAAGTCSPTCTSTITFTVSPSATPGTYPITVNGSPLSKTTSFNLVIAGNPIDVTCSPTEADGQIVFIGSPVTWTGGVSGGTPPYTYRWSGTNIPTLFAPSASTYTRRYSTIGLKLATLTVTDSEGIESSCEAGQVQVTFDPQFEEF